MEDLSGIRDRVRLARQQRTQLHSWAYAQLRAQITYKAERSGVPVAVVDPRNTSRTCSQCGYCDKANRVSQATFRCRHCQWTGHADHNAARNIAALGHRTYRAAQSTAPIAATPPAASENVSTNPALQGRVVDLHHFRDRRHHRHGVVRTPGGAARAEAALGGAASVHPGHGHVRGARWCSSSAPSPSAAATGGGRGRPCSPRGLRDRPRSAEPCSLC
ncbi:transposase [Rhodococcus sp. A14]|uniref:RNA-guided endonuclease InsQ/TnpB family protein n=1 Tax=Rhodococcus sp. A14 TaxID=1194106 RepID=UPI003216A2E9